MFDTYIRIGKCNQCGFCCSFHTGWMSGKGEKRFSYLATFKKMHLNDCCEQFDRRKAKCKIHDDQPHICKVFPVQPEHQIICADDCGYSFIAVKFEMVDNQ